MFSTVVSAIAVAESHAIRLADVRARCDSSLNRVAVAGIGIVGGWAAQAEEGDMQRPVGEIVVRDRAAEVALLSETFELSACVGQDLIPSDSDLADAMSERYNDLGWAVLGIKTSDPFPTEQEENTCVAHAVNALLEAVGQAKTYVRELGDKSDSPQADYDAEQERCEAPAGWGD
jgi:hypothetical protein